MNEEKDWVLVPKDEWEPAPHGLLTDEERKALSGSYGLLCERARGLPPDVARPYMEWANSLRGIWHRLGGKK